MMEGGIEHQFNCRLKSYGYCV